jgi:hypothetical protein
MLAWHNEDCCCAPALRGESIFEYSPMCVIVQNRIDFLVDFMAEWTFFCFVRVFNFTSKNLFQVPKFLVRRAPLETSEVFRRKDGLFLVAHDVLPKSIEWSLQTRSDFLMQKTKNQVAPITFGIMPQFIKKSEYVRVEPSVQA